MNCFPVVSTVSVVEWYEVSDLYVTALRSCGCVEKPPDGSSSPEFIWYTQRRHALVMDSMIISLDSVRVGQFTKKSRSESFIRSLVQSSFR